MKSNYKLIVFFIIFIIAISIVPVAAVDTGDDAPAFVLTDMGKNYVFSKKMYGNSWLLIDFYATWCENCNEELPLVEDLLSEFADNGFNVLLMATDSEGLDVVGPFFRQRPTTVTVLIDKYQKASGAFGVEALPSMFLVDLNGKIVFKTVGFHEEDLGHLRKILSDNLNE